MATTTETARLAPEAESATAEPAAAEPTEASQRAPSLRLLQITSSTFPTGAFAYSQGLETAVERGIVSDQESLERYLDGLLHAGLTRVDVPILARAYRAFERGDDAKIEPLCRTVRAFRESRELAEEDQHVGSALARALANLGVARAERFVGSELASAPVSFALGAHGFGIALRDAAEAFLFAWLENQVLAGNRLIPLGQMASQRALSRVLGAIPEAAERGLELDDDELGSLSPISAMLSAWHETQYTRLFRS